MQSKFDGWLKRTCWGHLVTQDVASSYADDIQVYISAPDQAGDMVVMSLESLRILDEKKPTLHNLGKTKWLHACFIGLKSIFWGKNGPWFYSSTFCVINAILICYDI